MKTAFMVLALSVISLSAEAAEGRLHCKNEEGTVFSSKNSENYDFAGTCDDAVYDGSICFTGDRGEAMNVLAGLNDIDIFGGEAFIRNIHFKGKSEISYTIWDGPNEMEATKNYVGRCDGDFFKKK